MREALYRAWARLRKGDLLAELARLEETQWLSRRAIEELQAGKLRAILGHAGDHVPYYRELFLEAGLQPGQVSGVADLKRLPVLDRSDLSRLFDRLRAETGPSAPIARATGGSTGRPVRFLVDRVDMTARSAHIYRSLRWLGWDIGARTAYVWGSDIDAREHRGWAGAGRDRIAGVVWIDAFAMNERELDDVLARLERFDPAAVIGYPSSLHLLARRALERGRPVALRAIETSAEMLLPAVRRDLQEAFGCIVLDRYGCREIGVVAHECPAGRMHINAEAVVMECQDSEVLLTGLNNRAMPLIRYRVEDLASLSDDACSCGRGLPLVERIHGRIADVIRTPSGRLIHGEFFTHLFYDAPGVARFQVVQRAEDLLEIRVVHTDVFTIGVRGRLEAAIRQHGDPDLRVVWESVREIPPGPSGKFRFVIREASPQGPPATG